MSSPFYARTPPKKRALSQELIVATAMRIVDEEGYDALSMRRIADELGTGPASLYAHVAHREELVDLLIDVVAMEIDVPDPDPEHWQEQLKDCVRGIRSGYAAHRDLARASLGRVPTGPGALRSMERVLAILVAGGLPRQVVGYAADLIAQFATVTAYEESMWIARMEAVSDPAELAQQLHDHFLRLDPAEFPHATDLVAELTRHEGDERFEFGLDAIVRGITAMKE